ncbi:hypothetical protein N8977_02325 [Alphaproteobacteria bacterium]|nr:hypothetical protein [Alphaproteobacteria bacterium]
MHNYEMTIADFVAMRNDSKKLFTAGPSSLLVENITGLMPCFGRGDDEYLAAEDDVLKRLMQMTGHEKIARMQGSGSLALEIMARNFLYGRVLVISTGYYSDRLFWLAESSARNHGAITSIAKLDWQMLDSCGESFDWIWACPTETSAGLKLPITTLSDFAKRRGARLMLDATASVGLEGDHHLADVLSYSSCKGLFGLTGGCFVAFNEDAKVAPDSFYLNINNHLQKRMTGPYHAIASLSDVLPVHDKIRESVVLNKSAFLKKMENFLTVEKDLQPLLCTHVSCEISTNDNSVVLYKARNNKGGSIVCHIGEAHLRDAAEGRIQDLISC